MKYVYRGSDGEDEMEIEADGVKVVGLTLLVDSPNPNFTYTVDDFNKDIGLYETDENTQLEDVLASFSGGYGSWRRVDE